MDARCERQPGVVLSQSLRSSTGLGQVIELGELELTSEGLLRESVQQRCEPPGKARRPPHSGQGSGRIFVERGAAAGPVVIDERRGEYANVGRGEVELSPFAPVGGTM